MKNLFSTFITAGIFMVVFFGSCSKEDKRIFSDKDNNVRVDLLEKRVEQIIDFIQLYRNYSLVQTQWRTRYEISASDLDAFIHLAEDAINYWHGNNIMEFTDSDHLSINVDISAYGDTLTT